MDLGIGGKVALVTAASRGLGRAAALALATEGARVVLSGRDAASLEEARQAVAGIGGEVDILAGDVTDPTEPSRLVQASVDRFGGLDILVANSGGPPPGHALELSDDSLLVAVNANLMQRQRQRQASDAASGDDHFIAGHYHTP